MPPKNLKIDQLELDVANPRISKANAQHEAMQRIIDDQDIKLANLAESIAEDGLNPMDRLLVIKSEGSSGKYTALEGNRRIAAMKILRNPAVLTGLDVRAPLQRKLEKLAQTFDLKTVEPIACYEVSTRTEGNSWIEQRHTGEDEGRGIVRWSGVAASRFRGRDPALQALDLVRQYGDLTDEQKRIIEGRFPITTLDRLCRSGLFRPHSVPIPSPPVSSMRAAWHSTCTDERLAQLKGGASIVLERTAARLSSGRASSCCKIGAQNIGRADLRFVAIDGREVA